jgi:glutathione peroxidase
MMKQGKRWFWTASFLAVFALMGMASTDMLRPTNLSSIKDTTMKTLHDFSATTLDGKTFDLSKLKGKKVLIVNTASECGLTPQYEQLQELYNEHGGDEFEIIGFPSNDFGAQEPGTDDQIAAFCQKNYGVSFPMMSKVHVKGEEQCEIYRWLTSKSENGVGDFEVQWNFHKFLIDENGALVKEVLPQTLPIDEEILSWIAK